MADYSKIVNTLLENYDEDKKYKIDTTKYNKIDLNIIIATILNVFTIFYSYRKNKKNLVPTYKSKKYFGLMHYVYELMLLCDKEDFDNLLENTPYLMILSSLNNGAIILYKLKKSINITKTKKLEYCYVSAEYGSYNTYKFWFDAELNDLVKHYNDINSLMLTKAISNPDERIYIDLIKLIKINTPLVKNLVKSLESSLNIPLKYKIRRIKILSNYIPIGEYFNTLIFNMRDTKLITHLYRAVIRTIDHNLSDIAKLYFIFIHYGASCDLKNLYPFLNDTEKDLLTLHIGHNIINPELHLSNRIRNLIKINYKEIIANLLKENELFDNNNKIIRILSEERLFNKFYYNEPNSDNRLLLFTRFYYNNKTKDTLYIHYNKVLHLLRIKMKKTYNKKLLRHLNKTIMINNEITNFQPINIPVLKKGSSNYQYAKQKFTNIPPRHLIATQNNKLINELFMYKQFLLREKPDGIQVNSISNTIYPNTDLFNNIKVKAEYIEEHDLYLVFDIDIPNTTIKDRYDILRKKHPFTNNINIEEIHDLTDFIKIMTKERENINKFMKTVPKWSARWYPKFAASYCNNDNLLIVNDFIDFINASKDKTGILSSFYYNCDGLILSPLNHKREIKIKPNNLLSIDLYYDGTNFIDYENNNMNSLLFMDDDYQNDDYQNDGYQNKVYRCYPHNDRFIIGEIRYDKMKPNKNNIIMNICNLLKYKFNNHNKVQEIYYEKKGILDYNLIQQLKDQTKLLENAIQSIEPIGNKKWCDLGCGSGKLLNHISRFNPSYYIGIDSDINKLIEASDNDSINFVHNDLNTNWADQINITFDYIVANFSIMHFFTEKFWIELNKVSKKDTLLVFNVPSNNWNYNKSYMTICNDTTYYHFDWVHNNDNKKEPYISHNKIYSTAQLYGWSVKLYYSRPNSQKLVDCYSWFILTKL